MSLALALYYLARILYDQNKKMILTLDAENSTNHPWGISYDIYTGPVRDSQSFNTFEWMKKRRLYAHPSHLKAAFQMQCKYLW